MKNLAAAVWLVIGALLLVGGFVTGMLWLGAHDGYDCGYLDAKRGRQPNFTLIRDDDCDLTEWR